MQHLEVSCAVRRFSKSLGFNGLMAILDCFVGVYLCMKLSVRTSWSWSINQQNCSVLPCKCKNGFPLHYIRATKYFVLLTLHTCRSQWSRRLRRRSTAARLLRSWVRIPPGAWMSVCCVLSGRGLCGGLITHPEESYRLWCVAVCDLEKQTSWMRRPRPTGGLSCQEKKPPT